MKSNHSFWDTVLKVSKSQFSLEPFYAKANKNACISDDP